MIFPEKVVIGSINYPKLCAVPLGNGTMPRSIEGSLVELLAKALKFEYTTEMPVDKSWGNTVPGGNSTGLIGMVERGEVDMAICFVSIQEERAKVLDFSYTYYHGDITFATHLPKFLPRFLIYTLPFQWKMWVSIFMTVVLLSLFLFALSGFKTSPAKSFLELSANILNQSFDDFRWNHVVLQGCWWTFVLVVSFSYKAVIQSYLTIPIHCNALKDFKELSDAVVKGEYNGIGPQSALRNFFLKNSRQHLVAIAKVMEKKNGFLPIPEYHKEEVIKEKTAVLGLRIMHYLRFGEPPLSTMYVPPTKELPFRIAVAVNKKFCCMNSLNKALRDIMKGGLYNKIVKDEEYRSWIIAAKLLKTEDFQHSLTLEDISGALVIFMIGILTATLVLMLEIYFKTGKKTPLL